MKLVRQTPETLVLQHRPIWLSGVLSVFAVASFGFGLWHGLQGDWIKGGVAALMALSLAAPAVWLGAERVVITFDARGNTCTIDTRHIKGPVLEKYALATVEHAEVQSHKGFGQGSAHRVALVLAPGRPDDRRPLTQGYAGARQAKDLAARINGWLEQARVSTDA